MYWIISGVALIIGGLYFKYQYYQAGNFVKLAEYLEKSNKLKNINGELEELIQAIDEKEKALQSKIDSLLQLENKLLEKSNSDSPQPEEQVDFKDLLNGQLAEKEESLPPDQETGVIAAKYQEVLQLYRQGLTAEEIARKLNLGIRETGLIIRLHGKEEDSIV